MSEFELCADTLEACHAAQQGGADRVELCAALSEGGVTPSRGLVSVALTRCALPVHVLVRPRGGNFVYSDDEFAAMCADVEDAIRLGAAGVVTGLLDAADDLDFKRTADLVRLAAGRPVTFHRAFDHTRDLQASLEMLIELGCSRVLSSGGRPDAMQGYDMLAALTRQSRGRIRVAAGGGVTLGNAPRLLQIPGLDLHASLRTHGTVAADGDPLWHMNTPNGDPSAATIRTICALVHG